MKRLVISTIMAVTIHLCLWMGYQLVKPSIQVNQLGTDRLVHIQIMPHVASSQRSAQERTDEGQRVSSAMALDKSVVYQSEKAIRQLSETAFLTMVHRHIDAHKRFPDHPYYRSKTGRVQVSFTLSRSGDVSQIRLMKKSPYERFNQSALAAIHQAVPFPRFPVDWDQSVLTITCDIVFHHQS